MRAMLLVGLALVAGCGPRTLAPQVMVQSPTAISIRATLDNRQAVEDMANRHCRAQGLVPRLTGSGVVSDPKPELVAWVYGFRYECQAPPR